MRLAWGMVREQPFRLFFPLAVAGGLAGTLIWPLHVWGWVEWYPGVNHARLMAQGFFGAFVVGFLGTALPRMMGAPRLTGVEIALLWGGQAALLVAHSAGRTALGDGLFLGVMGVMGLGLGWRWAVRRDVPPPGFVLVGLAWVCGVGGAGLGLAQDRLEDQVFFLNLRPLLQFQGFVLFPILGVGGFILPRFFGLASRQEFPESRTPPPGWLREAGWGLFAGLAVLGSFGLEAAGWGRAGGALRCLVSAGYLYWQVPFLRSELKGSSLALVLRVAFLLLPAGFLAVALFPGYRVALLHQTLVGGFGLLTICVATRVVLGHSGQGGLLKGRLRWVTVAAGMMLFGMGTRMSGDYWPQVMLTHYGYGAIVWAGGLVWWAVRVLPSLRRPDSED